MVSSASYSRGVVNIYDPEFEEGERPDGFRSRRARVGYQLGTELIGASVWELPSGQAAYPYHFHYADEEVIVVLAGRPTLRTPEGSHQLQRARPSRSDSVSRAPISCSTVASTLCGFWRSAAMGVRISSSTQTRARSEQESGCRAAADCERSSASKTPSTTGPTSRHPHKRFAEFNPRIGVSPGNGLWDAVCVPVQQAAVFGVRISQRGLGGRGTLNCRQIAIATPGAISLCRGTTERLPAGPRHLV